MGKMMKNEWCAESWGAFESYDTGVDPNKKIAIGLEKSDKEKTGVRGMDALVVQIAKEFKAPLVSLDREMTKRAKLVVKIVDIEDMVIL